MKVLCFERFGGPEVLEYREVPTPEPRPGHALVRMAAIGVNFADVYRRRGTYHLAGSPPYIPGYEGAGTIEAISPAGPGGPDGPVEASFQVNDRVAFADCPFANAEYVLVPLDKLVPVPADVSLVLAAGLMLQGLTAQYLVNDSRRLAAGEVALVHAAAGGVGSLLVQLVRLKGARPLAVVSSEMKARAALDGGAEAAFLYSEDWPARARAATPGDRGVDVAYDSIGATLLESFRATRTGGQVVFYGMAGGDPAAVDPRMLMDTSKTLTGGDLWNVLTSHRERLRRSAELFDQVRTGALKVTIAGELPLRDGAEAHRRLESRGTTGKLILVP
jgi:NADPH2:quinone reductase